MTAPGWYPNHENESELRYHDGERWTDHVHTATPVTEFEPLATEAVEATEPALAETPLSEASPLDPPWVRAVGYPLLGLFAGLVVGGFFFNALGAITPVTETEGTVRSIDVEYSHSSSTRNRRSYVLTGDTVDGTEWKIYNEDAYNVLQREGYPQQVTVAMGDWTGTAERVVGNSFQVDHQSTGGKIGWGLISASIAALTLGAVWLIARSKNGGTGPALLFLLMALPGSWLGFQAFQWMQSS